MNRKVKQSAFRERDEYWNIWVNAVIWQMNLSEKYYSYYFCVSSHTRVFCELSVVFCVIPCNKLIVHFTILLLLLVIKKTFLWRAALRQSELTCWDESTAETCPCKANWKTFTFTSKIYLLCSNAPYSISKVNFIVMLSYTLVSNRWRENKKWKPVLKYSI